MDLKGISEKAAEGRDAIDLTIYKKAELEQEQQLIDEVVTRIQSSEKPVRYFVERLMSLEYDRRNSPLVKIGSEGQNMHYFVKAQTNWVPSAYDADGNPRGRSFASYSLVASVGTRMTGEEYRALPAEERERVSYLGTTLQHDQMYGSLVAEETFGAPVPRFGTVEAATSYETRVGEILQNAAETIELIRRSLADEQLNPRGQMRVPEELL